jgi:outer membrane biosynthesis protein TonB
MADIKTNLELELEELAAGLASRVAAIVRGLTVEELLELTSGHEEEPPASRKKRTSGKRAWQRKKTKKKAAPRSELVEEPEPERPAHQKPEPEAAAPAPEPTPEPQPRPRPTAASSYRRAERERLEEAVFDFVSRNPGTDAEPVSARLGLPKSRAQTVLDDLVLRGTLSMTSGQHGRCYSVAGQQ